MRRLTTWLFLIVLIGGGWWLWNNQDTWRHLVDPYIESKDFLTLEARYTADQVMEEHRKDLLVDSQRSFQEPTLKFFPYMLMEVKYTLPDQKTREGVILWSLVDGEMVLNTDTWETTHGFEDCLHADASRTDFKILNALARNNNAMTVDQLQRDLKLEHDILEPWIESARQKHLIVKKGDRLELHFQNPKILVVPQSKINQWLVTKPYNHAQRVPKRFTPVQIEKCAKAAFGNDFTVRSMKEINLPVYNIEVLNPDGSILTSYWNALNGKRMVPSYILTP